MAHPVYYFSSVGCEESLNSTISPEFNLNHYTIGLAYGFRNGIY